MAVDSGPVEQIGWLGLGAMGVPMARRVAEAGHRVAAYDPTPGPLVTAGTPAEAAAECSVLVVCVATPAQAQDALFGVAGASATLRPGARVVLLSTLGPSWVRALSLPTGVRVVDAPVSGGVERAAAGDLLVMAAGAEPADVELLSVLGEVVVVGEEPGQGQAMKMVNQLLCGVHIAAAAEALALAEAVGIDPAFAWSTVRRGAAASFMFDDRGGRMVQGPDGNVRSALALFVKDLSLVLEESGQAELPTPVAAAAAQWFTRAGEAGLLRADDAELFQHVRSARVPPTDNGSGSDGDRTSPPDPA